MARSRRARQRQAEARTRAAAARQRQQNQNRARAAAPAAAPTPAAPAAPKPWDSDIQGQYSTTVGFNNAQADNTVAENLYQGQQLTQDYGLKTVNGQVVSDTSNPFNKMTMLQEAFERDRGNQATNFASQGQFFSGAYSSNKALLAHQNAADRDAITRDYTRQQHSYDYSNTQANTARTWGNAQANSDAYSAQLGR